MSSDNEEPNQAPANLPYDKLSLAQQHNGVAGAFNFASNAYKADPTIENYVRLRRSDPEVLVEVATSWSMDWLLANKSVLKQFRIDPKTVAGALDANPACISEISLRLLECLIERKEMEMAGEVHVQSSGRAIGDSLVNYLTAMMLDALDWNDELHIPRDLIVLIKHQIRADVSAEARAMEVHTRRHQAVWIAAQLQYQGERGSIRQVAKIMELSPSSVTRWFTDENAYDAEVQRQLALLRSDLFADLRKRLDSRGE